MQELIEQGKFHFVFGVVCETEIGEGTFVSQIKQIQRCTCSQNFYLFSIFSGKLTSYGWTESLLSMKNKRRHLSHTLQQTGHTLLTVHNIIHVWVINKIKPAMGFIYFYLHKSYITWVHQLLNPNSVQTTILFRSNLSKVLDKNPSETCLQGKQPKNGISCPLKCIRTSHLIRWDHCRDHLIALKHSWRPPTRNYSHC